MCWHVWQYAQPTLQPLRTRPHNGLRYDLLSDAFVSPAHTTAIRHMFCDDLRHMCQVCQCVQHTPQSSDICSVTIYVMICVRCVSVSSPHHSRNKLRWSYTHGVPEAPLLGVTIGNLLQRRTEQHPDRELAVFCENGERLSFEQLLLQVYVGSS